MEPRVLAVSVLATLRRLTDTTPVLLAIDDLQWLDPPSANALDFALRRLHGRRIAVAATTRAEPGTSAPLDVARIVTGGMREVTLGPLTVAPLFRLLRDRLGLELTRPQLVRLHDACGGNPLFALEIGRELQEGRIRLQPGAPVPVTESLLGLVERRTRRLPDATRRVLGAAAALGRPAIETLEQAFGAAFVERAIADGVEAGVLEVEHGHVRFTHPLFASASYTAVPEKARRAIHRQLAKVIDDPEERSRHLALASVRRNAAAAQALEDAAMRAAARGAPTNAAELAALAVALTPRRHAAQGERELLAAEYVFLSGGAGGAEEAVGTLVARLEPGPLRARAKILAARVAWEVRGSLDACRLCDEAIAEAGSEPVLAGEAHTWAAEFSDFDETARSRHARAAVSLLERATPRDEPRLAAALKALAESELVLGRGLPRDVVERAILLQVNHQPSRVSDRVDVAMGWWLVWIDELDEARERLEAGYRAAIEEGDESSLPQITGWLRELELRAGRLTRAREYALAQLEAAEQQGDALWVAVAKARKALVDAHLGLSDESRQSAQEALVVAEASTDAGLELLCEWALGSLALSLGDVADAAHWLTRADATHERIGLVEPGYARFHPDLIEALVGVGRLDDAESHLRAYEERATLTGRRSALGGAARCRALLLGVRGAGEEALEVLRRSRPAIEELGMPFELARTQLVEGMVLRRLRRRAEARKLFQQARAGFAELDAAAWLVRAEAELARTGIRRRVGDGLTETEQQVAALAARGLTNREIGAQVFLTEKSVEDVLRRIYRLIGVRNKTELAARLAERS